jgi:hypothetical protein
LAAIGIVFMLASLADLVLVFVPLKFGSAEWEFGTATSVMNNLPLFLVGIAFTTIAGFGKNSRSLLWIGAVVALLTWVIVAVLAVAFFRNVDEARRTVTDSVLKLGLSRSIIRTVIQIIVYLVGFAILGWKALGGARAGLGPSANARA